MKAAAERDTGPNVVLLAKSLGFPHGMAASNRVRLLAKAMAEAGAGVKVLCTQVSERPPVVENTKVRGVHEGIDYEYTTGATTRSNHFIVRRAVATRGIVMAAWRLVQLRLQGRVDCVYSYLLAAEELSWARVILLGLASALRIPVAMELSERPWTMREKPPNLGRLLSPLANASGAVAISGFLRDWAAEEAGRRGRRLDVLEVPVLVDVHEQTVARYPRDSQDVLFAASAAYENTLEFILESMLEVWDVATEVRLVITGWPADALARSRLASRVNALAAAGKILVPGYLARPALLARYGASSALLAPLFDDATSKARFPSKIAEYLASGRPVVATNVGEVRTYLQDGVNAFVAKAVDAPSFAQKTLEVLADPTRAEQVGLRGRELAEEKFDYALHGEALVAFLRGLVVNGKRR